MNRTIENRYLQQYGEDAHPEHLSAFAELMLAVPSDGSKP